jgi:hypothetical protein
MSHLSSKCEKKFPHLFAAWLEFLRKIHDDLLLIFNAWKYSGAIDLVLFHHFHKYSETNRSIGIAIRLHAMDR